MASEALQHGYSDQAELLSDGDVTLAEYDEATQMNFDCLVAAGLTHDEPVRNRVDGFRWLYEISYNGLDEATAQSAIDTCYVSTTQYVELAMNSWGDWQTDPALMTATEECLRTRGVTVESTAPNHVKLYEQISSQGITRAQIADCMIMSMDRLYPGEAFSIGS